MKFVLAVCLAAVSLALCSAFVCKDFGLNCDHVKATCDKLDIPIQLCTTSVDSCSFTISKCEMEYGVELKYTKRNLCLFRGAEVKVNCDIPKDAPLPYPGAPASTANDPTKEII